MKEIKKTLFMPGIMAYLLQKKEYVQMVRSIFLIRSI